jgi:hypothetical protein
MTRDEKPWLVQARNVEPRDLKLACTADGPAARVVI